MYDSLRYSKEDGSFEPTSEEVRDLPYPWSITAGMQILIEFLVLVSTIFALVATFQANLQSIILGNKLFKIASDAAFLSVFLNINAGGCYESSNTRRLGLISSILIFMIWNGLEMMQSIQFGPPVIYSPLYNSAFFLFMIALMIELAAVSLVSQLATKRVRREGPAESLSERKVVVVVCGALLFFIAKTVLSSNQIGVDVNDPDAVYSFFPEFSGPELRIF